MKQNKKTKQKINKEMLRKEGVLIEPCNLSNKIFLCRNKENGNEEKRIQRGGGGGGGQEV